MENYIAIFTFILLTLPVTDSSLPDTDNNSASNIPSSELMVCIIIAVFALCAQYLYFRNQQEILKLQHDVKNIQWKCDKEIEGLRQENDCLKTEIRDLRNENHVALGNENMVDYREERRTHRRNQSIGNSSIASENEYPPLPDSLQTVIPNRSPQHSSIQNFFGGLSYVRQSDGMQDSGNVSESN